MNRNHKKFLIIFCLLLFNNVIEFFVNGFSLIDEIYAYIVFAITLTITLSKKRKIVISNNELYIIILTFFIIIIGFVGNFKSGYQNNIYSIYSALTTIKFVLSYFTTKLIFIDFNLIDNKDVINKILIRLTIILITVGLIFNFINENKFYDNYYGAPALIMFFSHSTYLNAFCVCLITLLTYYLNIYKKNKYYIIILLIIMALTFKAKAFIFIALYLLFIIFNIFGMKSKKNRYLGLSILIILFIPVMGIVFKFFHDKYIYFTVTYANTARNILTKTSFLIARQYLPWGLGFGTFASAISGKYYSQAYYDYGISQVYGIVPGNARYVSDTFWPMILAENGALGFCAFIAIIYFFIRQVIKNKTNSEYWFAALIPILYLLISSLAESSFVNQIAVTLFHILAVINITSINENEKKGIEYE